MFIVISVRVIFMLNYGSMEALVGGMHAQTIHSKYINHLHMVQNFESQALYLVFHLFIPLCQKHHTEYLL
jgi:hypothetical protein